MQLNVLTPEIMNKLEATRIPLDRLRDMDAAELGHLVHHVRMGDKV